MTSGKTPADIERDSYNLELSGDNFTLKQKFIDPKDRPDSFVNKKKKEFEEMSALVLRLQNKEYAKLYYELGDTIAQLERLTDQAIEEVEFDIEHQDKLIKDAMKNATYLHHSGTAVFKDGEAVRTLEGTEITDQVLLDSIVWKEDSPSYSEIRALHDNKSSKTEQLEELKQYRYDTLGTARDRWEDEDEPLSKEEMQQMQSDLYKKTPELIKIKLEETKETIPEIADPHKIQAFTM